MFQIGAAPVDESLGLAEIEIDTARHARQPEWHVVVAVAQRRPDRLDVANSRLGTAAEVAHRRDLAEKLQSRMVYSAGVFDQFFGPRGRFVIFRQKPDKPGERSDGGGHIQIVWVGGAAKGGPQIGQPAGEPFVGLALAGAIPP